jgi:hypothetical protein
MKKMENQIIDCIFSFFVPLVNIWMKDKCPETITRRQMAMLT